MTTEQIVEVIREMFDPTTVDTEFWAELAAKDDGQRIHVEIAAGDLKRVQEILAMGKPTPSAPTEVKMEYVLEHPTDDLYVGRAEATWGSLARATPFESLGPPAVLPPQISRVLDDGARWVLRGDAIAYNFAVAILRMCRDQSEYWVEQAGKYVEAYKKKRAVHAANHDKKIVDGLTEVLAARVATSAYKALFRQLKLNEVSPTTMPRTLSDQFFGTLQPAYVWQSETYAVFICPGHKESDRRILVVGDTTKPGSVILSVDLAVVTFGMLCATLQTIVARVSV